MNPETRDKGLMEIAFIFARNGTCSRLQTGAVIAREGRVLSSGYNGTPAGLVHCQHEDPKSLHPSDACRMAVHAELNAVAFAAREGIATKGATIYCTHMPCVACAQAIINAGIVRVVYGLAYRDASGVTMLLDAGLVVEEI